MSNKKQNLQKILQRIKQAYNLQTDADLARFLGVKPNTLAMQKKRDSIDWDRILEKCKKLNRNWLIDGSGPMEMLEQDDVESTGSVSRIPYYKSIDSIISSPVPSQNGSSIAMGKGFIEHILQTNPDNTMLVSIIEDSMSPTLNPNDLALIDQSRTEVDSGSIYLIKYENQAHLKRIQTLPNSKYLLISDNSSVDSITIHSRDDELEILGRLVWVGKKF